MGDGESVTVKCNRPISLLDVEDAGARGARAHAARAPASGACPPPRTPPAGPRAPCREPHPRCGAPCLAVLWRPKVTLGEPTTTWSAAGEIKLIPMPICAWFTGKVGDSVHVQLPARGSSIPEFWVPAKITVKQGPQVKVTLDERPDLELTVDTKHVRIAPRLTETHTLKGGKLTKKTISAPLRAPPPPSPHPPLPPDSTWRGGRRRAGGRRRCSTVGAALALQHAPRGGPDIQYPCPPCPQRSSATAQC